MLERAALDGAGGEGAVERMGMVAAHGLDLRGGERRPVERAPRGRLGIARAQPLLAKHRATAGVELEVVAHLSAVLFHKADHAAVMVAVRMAEDQPVEMLAGFDAEQIEVAQQDFRRVAEIKQVLPFTAAVLGFR